MDITKELPTVISFCSGYGGIERGLDLAGVEHRVLAYVEIEAFAAANLVAKMESGQLAPAPIWTNLKTFPAHLFRGCVDIITGGYPCQPFSAAGARKGTDDPRHLWPFIRRHTRTIRPARCFFENVEGHISLGLSSVLRDLEDDGYAAAWGIFSAEEVGAPHRRKRVFIMADSTGNGGRRALRAVSSKDDSVWEPKEYREGKSVQSEYASENEDYIGQKWPARPGEKQHDWEPPRTVWKAESKLGGAVDGSTHRVDRIRLLGNGVVPQTAAKAWITLQHKIENSSNA